VSVDRDFFVSFTGADRPWAAWLLAELDAAGYSSVSQLRDFVAGSNFITEMQRAARRARRTLGVLSPHALRAPFVWQEWAQRLAGDPTGEQRALLLVRIQPCEPEGLLGPVVYVDLVDLDEASARARLREELAAAVRGKRMPAEAARFPGGAPAGGVADLQRPRFPTALPPVWNVPYRRNPAFTGREQLLAELADQLELGAATAVTQALQGGGGVGKTALAVEYAYRHRAEFDAVWWVRAEEPATLVGDLAGLAVALRLAEAGQADQQVAVLAVRRWLDGHDRWLLVLDNAQAPDAGTGLDAPLARLVDLIPQVLHGQVLVTSRDASWEEHASLAELEVFTPEEAVGFLLVRSRIGDPATAGEIAELLGWLPLGLEQAGAYVRQTRLPLATYLDRLRQFPALTVARGRPRDRDPADTVATTWQVSMERVRPIPGAVALLEVCAFLGPEEIPRDLFNQALDPMPEELAVLAGDPFALDEAVAGLHRFGLVKADEQTLTVHRLVQQVVRDDLDAEQERRAWARRVVDLLRRAFPADPDEPSAWPRCDQLLAHVLAATDNARAEGVAGQTSASLLTDAGVYLRARAGLPLAQTVLEQAVEIREAALGAGHPDVALTLTYLGTVLRRRGEPDSARQVLERALAIRERALGPDHPDVAMTLTHLGTALRDVGDLSGGQAVLERALAIREAALGAGHPDVALTLTYFGTVLRRRGEPDSARQVLERALAINKAVYGPQDPRLAVTMAHLGHTFRELGDLTQARAAHERALAIRQGVYHGQHPEVAFALRDLGRTLRDAGDLAEARSHVERALGIFEATYGPEHPETASSLDHLAAVLHDQGNLRGARTLLERALAIYEARLGADHWLTARSLSNLATILADQGDLQGARPLHERALAIRQVRLGPDHPDTAWSLSNLAGVLRAQGDLQGARTLHERTLTIRETRLGADHPDTVRSRERLAAVVAALDK